MLGYGFGFHPTIPGLGLWCVRLGSGFGLHPANPDLGFGACVFVCALRPYPAIPGSGMQCGCVCLVSAFRCAPAFLAWVLSWCVHSVWTPPIVAGVCGVSVCALAPVLAAPRNSWLGCWVVCFGVCVPPVPRLS